MEFIYKITFLSVNGGFWQFVGCWVMVGLILGIPSRLIFVLMNRIYRHRNIRKHGWPPSHCDGDGDFPSKGNS